MIKSRENCKIFSLANDYYELVNPLEDERLCTEELEKKLMNDKLIITTNDMSKIYYRFQIVKDLKSDPGSLFGFDLFNESKRAIVKLDDLIFIKNQIFIHEENLYFIEQDIDQENEND